MQRRTPDPEPASSGRRGGWALPVVLVIVGLVALAVVLAVVATTTSRRDSSRDPDPTSTPTLDIRHVTVAAFGGTDLQQESVTAAIVASTRLLPEFAAHDLTGREAGTIWNTATKATAPDGTVFDVFLLAVSLKSDPQHPSSEPTFADSEELGSSSGLGAGWRSTTELGPLSGPPWYPSATNLSGRTLLFIRLDVVPGAEAELRRLTSQFPMPVRERYLAATRPG